ncbi:WxL domain-containing protein [Enterococcus faecalis]|uniref:WxL domain-containing protein n=1 Tax=Enterococcus faecalis TaxID=1351 RepID=UPI00288F150C|nr:WxL domain-containing protein [Enterococcus faecalis]MDT2190186.1 WxL domain-containing protein [Enterococcus faecalis]
MKQIRFKHLVTLGLCCSLLVNSITGITAIAETVTIESSPTVESTKESTKESTEESAKESAKESTEESTQKSETSKQEEATTETTGVTEKTVSSDTETREQSTTQEVVKEEEPEQTKVEPQVSQNLLQNRAIGVKAGNLAQFSTQFVNLANSFQTGTMFNVPEARIGVLFKSDVGALTMSDFGVSTNMTLDTWETYGTNTYTPRELQNISVPVTIASTTNGFDITIPKRTLSVTVKNRTILQRYYLNNIGLTVPKYVENISISKVGTAKQLIKYFNVASSQVADTPFNIEVEKSNNTSYLVKFPTGGTLWGAPASYTGYNVRLSTTRTDVADLRAEFPTEDIQLTVSHKKVTENFKDVNGTAIPAPTGFTQGKKTSITNNNYTFKQSGTLPETYKASNGKNYKFKGWYKGKTKPATLKTTKTPSYAVTYDNNDDLNVVYEVDTTKDYKFPSSTVNFQFVNEAGAILLPTPFTITTDLQQEINSTYTKLGSITGTNSGNTKQVTIPAKTIKADVSLGGVNNYGTTNTRITIPKFYENISLYTGNAYTQATFNQYSTVGNTLIGAPHNNAPLYYGLSKVTATQFKMNEFASGSNYMYSRLFVATNPYKLESYYTTVGTVYYQLTNRKVTENFVDTNGVKITAPTGFTQGKKTNITNTDYTFTQSGTLPSTYKTSNGKVYKLKGWYKGNTKPTTLNTGKPTYKVTYNNNDDLNVVYEETSKDYKFPSRTVNFQFVNEAGAILLPTPFTITTDLQQEINSTYTKLGSITGTNSGNTKQVTIPARTIKADVSLGGVNNYGTTNTRITIPKFYENISLYTGSAYTQALFNQYSTVGNTLIGAPNNNAPLYYGLSKVTATQFKMNEFASGANYMYSRLFVATNPYKLESYYTTVGTVYYQLTNRKVTENFVDTNGVKITAPTGFTQGKKTNITNTDYTFTQSGTLPSTYKTSNGKVYKLKGWYKGNTKPATLNTGKPTYKVTYNNNDDLNVVYEETSKDYKFPSRTVNFQFVNEAGAVLLPTPFTITTDLQQEINSTYTKLGSITGINSGNTKQVTIPARTIRADVSLGGVNNYGTTNTRITIPKFYENISLYTGSTYTQATLNEYLTVNNALTGTPASNPPLYYGLNKVTATQFKVNEYDSTNATMPERSKYLYNRLYIAGAANNFNSYYTTVGTVYYQLTNRKVTENFVDTNGVKITAPTGFTQGKKTNITNTDYTFTQSGTLPSTYKTSNGKVYKLKGWYKGNTKPATLNTGKPTYKVTYNNNDDLNVVYEETSKDYKFPSSTVNFQFVNEAGTIISPTPFTITTDLQQEINSTYTKLGSITGTNSGNTKQVTIPAKTIRADVSLGGVNNYGTTNTRITIPKFYENISVYTGSAYTQATLNRSYITESALVGTPSSNAPLYYGLSKVTATQFKLNEYNPIVSTTEKSKYTHSRLFTSGANNSLNTYQTPVGTIYYQLTNRKVTENFVDTNGVKITAPTGFTQGKKTNITNTDYTFTQSGTLPSTYKTSNGKVYKLKGWYKGNTKPATLNTGKPTYKVTYNNNDDLNVVYEETSKDYKFPSSTVNFQFVNEAGTIISPTPFTITTDLQQEINSTYTKLGSITGTNSGNTKQVTIPARTIKADVSLGGVNNYGTTNTRITIPKFYENISLYTGSTYTQATFNQYSTADNTLIDAPHDNASWYFGLSEVTTTQFKMEEFDSTSATMPERSKYLYNRLYVAGARNNFNSYYTTVGTVYYQLTNRKVTENFVDASGTKITPPTGFTQGNQIPMTSDTFKYTSAKALPASYSAGGKTYVFQGWYKGKTKPNTLTTSTTPTYNTTFDDNDDMTAVYKEASISANLTMRGAVDVIDNGGTMEYWEVLLKNTGEAPLTSIKIKPTTDWAAGISTPTELFILGTGQNTKVRPITKEQWKAGFEIPLDKSLPVGGQLTINLIGTKVTGQPNQVLKAAVEVSGNFNKLTASDTVRIKDLDQETKEPTGEGFISVPTFDFGQVGVASVTKQHGLKKAADYYGNGTRNPYVRISKTQPNWSLTAQLSQPKSATDSLPTATRLILGQVPIYSVGNYNLPTELMTSVGVTRSLGLTADNSSVSIIGNQEFSGADVYQLDFQFDKVKLEVPANQGVKGQQYQAAVTWNLVTGP